MDTPVAKILLLCTIFGATFLLFRVLIGWTAGHVSARGAINHRLKLLAMGAGRDEVIARLRKNAPRQIEGLPRLLQRVSDRVHRMLLASGLRIGSSQLLAGMLGGVAVVFLLLLALVALGGGAITFGTLQLAVMIAVCAGAGVPLFIISFLAQRRRRRIEQQFPVALDIFVRALRSGHPIASGLNLLTEEMEDPIGSEFGLVADEVAYGADLTDALEAMADRWDLEDMRMFTVSLAVQSETGGNLAEILEGLSGVIRARAAMFMKVRALSSEGRMTGWILTALPIFAFVSLFATNPQFYFDVAADPIFKIGFSGLIALYLVGFFTIRKMVDVKV